MLRVERKVLQGLNEKVTKLLATAKNTERRRTSSPSVHSSKWGQGMTRAVPIFKPDVNRPTDCRDLCSSSSLGAPARTRRGAARCQQHERARWWHLQHDSLLQSNSHATGRCRRWLPLVHTQPTQVPVCSERLAWDATITTPTSSTTPSRRPSAEHQIVVCRRVRDFNALLHRHHART